MVKPAISTIEFTNACNFNCSYCQRTDEDGVRLVGMFSITTLKIMAERGDFENTLYCEFQQNGEPTIHPKFAQMVAIVKSVVPYVGLSTNGTYHKFAKANEIEAALLSCDCITLSIHKETTQFDVDNFVEKIASKTKVRIQTLDCNSYGLDLKKHEGKVYFDNYEIREFRKEYSPKHCLDPQASVTIQWDGDVVACCNVVGKQRVYGNIKKESLADIWSKAPKTMFDYCKTCKTPSPYAKRLNFLAETLNS